MVLSKRCYGGFAEPESLFVMVILCKEVPRPINYTIGQNVSYSSNYQP